MLVGDTLSGATTLLDAYERDGRQGGAMTFAVLETEYTDEDDALVLTERETLIETEGATNGDTEVDPSLDGSGPERGVVRESVPEFDRPSVIEDVAAVNNGPRFIVDGLSRQNFVCYAGASGDFNPVHYDERYARELGNPSVFAQGMFTAGLAGRFVTNWFGIECLSRFRTRFTDRVWPDDLVIVSGKVSAVEPPTVTVEFTVDRQPGDMVLTGDADVVFPSLVA